MNEIKDKKDKKVWAGLAISILASLPFIPSAAMKIMGSPQVIEGMAHLGIPQTLVTTLAVLEVLSLILYLIPQTSVLGAILLTGYLGGAICTHLRVGEAVYSQVTFGVLVWLGLYLRDARIRELLPLRR